MNALFFINFTDPATVSYTITCITGHRRKDNACIGSKKMIVPPLR
jgi:hypothetical protein